MNGKSLPLRYSHVLIIPAKLQPFVMEANCSTTKTEAQNVNII